MDWLGIPTEPLWRRLQQTNKTVVLYGMGNGGDKILSVCAKKGIAVSAVFASDGFVRGQSFHGMRVQTWKEVKEAYGAENLIVLVAFATSLPEVLENVLAISREAETYAPDVPVFGEGLFDEDFLIANQASLLEARALLSDEESRFVFDAVIRYKLTGDINYLWNSKLTKHTSFKCSRSNTIQVG